LPSWSLADSNGRPHSVAARRARLLCATDQTFPAEVRFMLEASIRLTTKVRAVTISAFPDATVSFKITGDLFALTCGPPRVVQRPRWQQMRWSPQRRKLPVAGTYRTVEWGLTRQISLVAPAVSQRITLRAMCRLSAFTPTSVTLPDLRMPRQAYLFRS
jgi:hypothetical protein